MQIFNQILFYVNNVILGFCTAAFSLQVIYFLLFWLPKKKWKKAEIEHSYGVLLVARNEENVIADAIKSIQNQNYNKEKYDIFVVAHNCTDRTAEISRELGCTVFEFNDEEPSRKKKAYALDYGCKKLLTEYDDKYEAFLIFDADTIVHPDYFTKMNDAYDHGVKLARGYQNSKNIGENVISSISGLWYIRDSRYSCRARERLHISNMLIGTNTLIDKELLRETNGWTSYGSSEDAEYTVKQLLRKNKCHFVEEAVVYDDQPTTLKDCFNRYKRCGHGLNKLFWKDGIKCIGKFFTTFDFSYIDMFLTLLFIPIALLCCVWMPLYYGYDIIYSLVVGNMAHVMEVVKLIGVILLYAFLIPFIAQSLLVVILEHKRIKVKSFSKLIIPILIFPFFMVVYAIGVTLGILSRPKWKAIKRTGKFTYDDVAAQKNKNEGDELNDAISEAKPALLLNEAKAMNEEDNETIAINVKIENQEIELKENKEEVSLIEEER